MRAALASPAARAAHRACPRRPALGVIRGVTPDRSGVRTMGHLHMPLSHAAEQGALPTPERRAGGTRWLAAPSVAVLVLWMTIPLAMTIWYSFTRYNLLNPDEKGFAGFDNYLYLVTDPSFVPSIVHTLELIGWVLVITVVGGILMKYVKAIQTAIGRFISV
jgi:sorbitol/mannitol transport system permease protein